MHSRAHTPRTRCITAPTHLVLYWRRWLVRRWSGLLTILRAFVWYGLRVYWMVDRCWACSNVLRFRYAFTRAAFAPPGRAHIAAPRMLHTVPVVPTCPERIVTCVRTCRLLPHHPRTHLLRFANFAPAILLFPRNASCWFMPAAQPTVNQLS